MSSRVFKSHVNHKHKVNTKKKKGIVYVMANRSMPGIVKIGMTRRPLKHRLMEANKSNTFGPPDRYYVICAKHVEEAYKREQEIHFRLINERVRTGREFFRISHAKSIELIDGYDGVWCDEDEDEDEDEDDDDETKILKKKRSILPRETARLLSNNSTFVKEILKMKLTTARLSRKSSK